MGCLLKGGVLGRNKFTVDGGKVPAHGLDPIGPYRHGHPDETDHESGYATCMTLDACRELQAVTRSMTSDADGMAILPQLQQKLVHPMSLAPDTDVQRAGDVERDRMPLTV